MVSNNQRQINENCFKSYRENAIWFFSASAAAVLGVSLKITCFSCFPAVALSRVLLKSLEPKV
jgi:hypothetical protein